MRALHWGAGKSGRVWGLLLTGALLSCSLIGISWAEEEAAPRRTKRENRPTAEAFPTTNATGEQPGANGQSKVPAGHPLARAIKRAYESRKAMEEVRDYSALFVKKERIRGNPPKMVEQVIDLKLRHEPFSVYMRFRSPEAGREVLYVAGANNGKLLVHEEGIKSIAGTIPLAIDDPAVKKENRHPITQVGIVNLLDVIIAQWEAESKFGEVDVKRYPNAKLGDVACEVWMTIHPEPRKEFAFHKTVLYLDKQTKFPIRLEQYGWPRDGRPAALIEEYTYAQLKTNVNLQDGDFDVRNRNYRFH